jgi:hypothetical protein
MTELINTNEISWNDYKVEFLTGKDLKDFLMSEAIPCLSCRFKNPEEFFENIIFKIPGGEDHKLYKMIYSHLVLEPSTGFLNKTELAEKHSINEEHILAEGSVTLYDTSLETKPLVRWLIVKN